jgi:hypothetical protein
MMTLTIDILVLIEGLALLVCGVWFVAKITATLGQLTNSLQRLERIVERLDERLDNHEARIIQLESKK